MFWDIRQIMTIDSVWFSVFSYNIHRGDDYYVETVKMEPDSDVGMLYHSRYSSDHIPRH